MEYGGPRERLGPDLAQAMTKAMTKTLVQARTAVHPVCPMCLMLFLPGRTDGLFCPGCRTGTGRAPVQLMEREEYLSSVNLDVVEGFWRDGPARPELRELMLGRVAELRRLQERG